MYLSYNFSSEINIYFIITKYQIKTLTLLLYIQDGSITCTAKLQPVDCPAINCIDPVQDPTTCCPVCEGTQSLTCQYAGRQYEAGQEVPASAGRCEVCQCLGGLIECSRRRCPAVNCRNPGNDGCCDTCNGENFKSYQPPHWETNNLHIRKQRRRSASQ